jgi:fatty-acid peroxygenase
MTGRQLARALGWLSLGLGVAQVIAPRRVGKLIGVREHTGVLRTLGGREMATGIGLLAAPRSAAALSKWMWARVGGDVLDLVLLGAALRNDKGWGQRDRRKRMLIAFGALAPVVAADLLCARHLTATKAPAVFPRDEQLDSTLALLSEGYEFIPNRCQQYQTDIFETRLMLSQALCVTGAEAAQMFYQPDRFTRKRALPPTALLLLQDRGSVQLQDGAAHRNRKQMFLSLMTPTSIQQLVDLTAAEWRARLAAWEAQPAVVLHTEVQEILCRAVCAWAGIALTEAEAKQRTREFAAMVDGAGSVGPRNWRGLLLRARTERWARKLIEQVRTGAHTVPTGSAAQVIAQHLDQSGKLLDTRVAAVELINVLRPTVAVAWYITFTALALHEHPECRQQLLQGDGEYLEWFVQEVRRFYPFFPAVGGRVAQEFDWRGHRFTQGTWVLLDLYGTNHDARIWQNPEVFRPERFRDWDHSAFNLIPQGGGDLHTSHRCPGERITLELMKTAVRLLTTEMQYEVPEQDLRYSLARMPALPQSRFVIRSVQMLANHAAKSEGAT